MEKLGLSPIVLDIILSFFVILLAVLYRSAFHAWMSKWNLKSKEIRRRWKNHTRIVAGLIIVVGLSLIWAQDILDVAISIAALAVALVIASKEIIMCFTGSLIKSSSKSFRVGSEIEIAGVRGNVVDHTLLHTVLLERGSSGEFTGRSVTIPNSLFLSHVTLNSSIGNHYGIHRFKFSVIKELTDLRSLKEELQPYLNELTSSHFQIVDKIMNKYAEIQAIDTPIVYNEIWFDFSDPVCNKLMIQFCSKVDETHEIEQKLLIRLQELVHKHIRQAA